MKAVQLHQFGAVEELFIGEVPEPEKAAEQILVKVHASALNRADLLQRQGKYPPPPGESEILGLEMAGTVVVPDKSGKWRKGDRVMALLAGGGQAEYAVVHLDHALPIPDNLSFAEAAAIPEVFLTAYQAMFFEGALCEGDTILIHAGASGVGTAALQMAKEKGAAVITTCSGAKQQACRELGADLTIDYTSEPFVERVGQFTSGKGVNMVLDFVGGPNFTGNIEVLAVGGHLVLIAMLGGAKATEVNLYPILRKHLKITGTTLRSRPNSYKTDLIERFAADFADALAEGSLKPVIDSVFDWRDIQQAHLKMEANKNIGKIILDHTNL